MSSDYARQLFDRLRSGDDEDLLGQLQHPSAEADYLDFKLSASGEKDLKRRRLCRDDLKTLAKSIGGFANSMGGTIVWGLECNDKVPGPKRKLLPGLQDADALQAVLQTNISKATIPGVPGVEIERYETNDGVVLLLMFVPKVPHGPIRSVSGKLHRYYFRIADSFHVIPHNMLAAMFGVRPPCKIVPVPYLGSKAKIQVNNGVLRFRLLISLRNEGQRLAKFPYQSISVELPGEQCATDIFSDRQHNERYDHIDRDTNSQTIMGVASVRIPPGTEEYVTDLTVMLSPPFDNEFVVRQTTGAEDSLAVYSMHKCSAALVESVYEECSNEPIKEIEIWRKLFPDMIPKSGA